MRGRLNSFQKTMLQWNDLHPYNVVHVACIPAPLDMTRAQRVIDGVLKCYGVNRLSVDRKRGRFGYLKCEASSEIKLVEVTGSSRTALDAEIEQQINTPFGVSEDFSPFRFFVVPEAGAFWLGLVYFHLAADAESIVLLMKDLVTVYQEDRLPALAAPINLYPEPHNLLRRPVALARKLFSLPAFLRAMRQSCRPPYRNPAEMRNGFDFFALDTRQLSALVEAGRLWEVTVNDLFLAILLKSVSPLAAQRLQARRRRKISVGCIVNVRRDLRVDSRETFGVFLGSFVVTHQVPKGIPLTDLARDIRSQTASIKQKRLYLGMPLELAVGRFLLSFFSTERKRKLYQKNYPLWGGITNMNLNSIWDQRNSETPVDYLRAVSTGPATPLVLSVTTVGKSANIGLTYRSTVYSRKDIEQMKATFLATIPGAEARP